MARRGQAAYRRKRAHAEVDDGDQNVGSEGGDGQPDELNPRAQCLPVGELPDDFDGVPLDGAQFLAMANKVNEQLPFSKSVPNPYRAYSPSIPAGDTGAAQSIAQASSSRFPALPNGSWEVLFPLHFKGYRQHMSTRWPPSPPLPYPADYPPIPVASHRSQWFMFINGYTAEEIQASENNPEDDRRKAKEKARAVMDEEEAMNAVAENVDHEMDGDGGDDDDDQEEEVESEGSAEKTKTKSKGKGKARAPPREPLVGVVSKLSSTQAIRVLSHFAIWLDETIEQLPSPLPPSPSDFLPTQPAHDDDDENDGDANGKNNAKSSTAGERRRSVPLSTNYLRWIFALLVIVDPHLSSNQISALRELARAATRVAGWRWVRAVVARELGDGWRLGQAWVDNKPEKLDDDAVAPPEVKESSRTGDEARDEEDDVDQTLARCWMVVYAVAAGWGQTDLISDLESLFS